MVVTKNIFENVLPIFQGIVDGYSKNFKIQRNQEIYYYTKSTQIDGNSSLHTYNKCNILIILKLRSNQTFSFTYYKKKKCRQNGVTAKLDEERDFFDKKLTLK